MGVTANSQQNSSFEPVFHTGPIEQVVLVQDSKVFLELLLIEKTIKIQVLKAFFIFRVNGDNDGVHQCHFKILTQI